jgi:hypothetical protein
MLFGDGGGGVGGNECHSLWVRTKVNNRCEPVDSFILPFCVMVHNDKMPAWACEF